MQQWLKEVARGKRGSKDLSYETTKEVASAIINGDATDAQIAAYFIAQRLKTESPEELLAFVHAFQECSDRITVLPEISEQMVDFAGPYNGRNTFASTIPSAILLADYGIPALLHSSDTLPPKYGVSILEILSHLGVHVNKATDSLTQTVAEHKIGFASTEDYCPSLREVRPIREQIGVRTLLNTVEKLLNLGNASTIMMGAFHRTAINKIYPIFKGLSYQNVYIVQGIEGSEDLPVHRNSFIFRLTEEALDSEIVRPEDYGMKDTDFDKTKKLTAHEQVQIITAILSGEQSQTYNYYYKQVLFNTGIRFYLFGVAKSIEEGIDIARQQLQNQNGLDVLNNWKTTQLNSLASNSI